MKWGFSMTTISVPWISLLYKTHLQPFKNTRSVNSKTETLRLKYREKCTNISRVYSCFSFCLTQQSHLSARARQEHFPMSSTVLGSLSAVTESLTCLSALAASGSMLTASLVTGPRASLVVHTQQQQQQQEQLYFQLRPTVNISHRQLLRMNQTIQQLRQQQQRLEQ